jgi:hypothetical protein
MAFFLVLVTVVIRFWFGGYINRDVFRGLLDRIGILVIVLYVTAFYQRGLYRYIEDVVEYGLGGYPLQYDFIMLSTVILSYILVLSLSLACLIYLSIWESRLDWMVRLGNHTLDMSIIVFGLLVGIRLFSNHLFLSSDRLVKWNIFDILVFCIGVSILFLKDSNILSRKRIIGILPVSSAFTLLLAMILLLHVRPMVILNFESAVKTDILIFLSTMLLISYMFIVGRSVFRRPLYPWLSEDPEYFVRTPSSSIYILIILSVIYMIVALSVYFSAGREVFPNVDYVDAIVLLLLSSVLILVFAQVIIRWRKNFYAIYGVLFLLVFSTVVVKSYNLGDIYSIVYLLIGIGILASIYILVKRLGVATGVNIYSILILFLFIAFFLGYFPVYSGVTEDIAGVGYIKVFDLDVRYLNSSVYDSPHFVVRGVFSNETLPLYRVLTLNVDINGREYFVRRVVYPSKGVSVSFSILYPKGLFNIVKLELKGLTGGETPSANIVLREYTWSNFYYYLIPLLIIISYILYDKDIKLGGK